MYKELWIARIGNSEINGFVDNVTTTINKGALQRWTNLKGIVYFNACTTIITGSGMGEPPFYNCNFNELHLPNVTSVTGYQLFGNLSINKVYMDKITRLPDQFGRSMTSCSEIHFPSINVDTAISALNSSEYFWYVSSTFRDNLTMFFNGGNAVWNSTDSVWEKTTTTSA